MWWLVVFIYLDGAWVPGAELEHWHPRGYETRAECLERKAFAEEALAGLEHVEPSKWFCTRDKEASLETLEAREADADG